jgi:hypothetical protein
VSFTGVINCARVGTIEAAAVPGIEGPETIERNFLKLPQTPPDVLKNQGARQSVEDGLFTGFKARNQRRDQVLCVQFSEPCVIRPIRAHRGRLVN